mmetsp:Transcript_7609/g.12797  ORF Transcript_7609/g.12797 Transcript_7609/m.12797 type:complete len:141 (+) Transcript_7609:34-456(+)
MERLEHINGRNNQRDKLNNFSQNNHSTVQLRKDNSEGRFQPHSYSQKKQAVGGLNRNNLPAALQNQFYQYQNGGSSSTKNIQRPNQFASINRQNPGSKGYNYKYNNANNGRGGYRPQVQNFPGRERNHGNGRSYIPSPNR